MSRVTVEEIEQINKLYAVYRNYSRVAKEVGRAPSTVKRYIDPNYVVKKKELQLINWEKIESTHPIDLQDGSIGGYTCGVPRFTSINAFFLDETPHTKGKYIITNNFHKISIPRLAVSYGTLEARLIGMTYNEYFDFCEKCLGAIVSKNKEGTSGIIYFDNTEIVQKLIRILNKKFKKSYEQLVTLS